MDYLRRIVSGKKNRYEGEGFNLDLTYITPRVIAMSLPGEGVHKVYRNSITSVSKFLNEKHRGNYRIFNLSGLKYSYEKFGGSVKEYPWADHYPPPIELLFYACNDMHQWLCLDVRNVVAVNCKAGKGRTGTLICCYLMYSGRIQNPEDALRYYKNKRFSTGGGVTQPSQIRYVHYFAQVLYRQVKSPSLLQLSRIRVKTAPHMSNSSCKPIIEIKHAERTVFSSKKSNRDKQSVINDEWENEIIHELALINSEIILQGDVHCFLYHWGRLKVKKICRFSFNTGFIRGDSEIVLNKQELDPDAFRDNKKVSDKFGVILEFVRFCLCNSVLTVNERCEECKRMLEPGEIEKWDNISSILMQRIVTGDSECLFGLEKDNIHEELMRNTNDSRLSSEESMD